MTKEILTLQNAVGDLKTGTDLKFFRIRIWRLCFIIPLSLIALIDSLWIRSIWICLPTSILAVYHIARFLMAANQWWAEKKMIREAAECGEITVSIETVSHIAEETVYEPHLSLRGSRASKQVSMFYFQSGGSFRLPEAEIHYSWSNEHYISTKGLINITCSGDEFYLVSLMRNREIAYVYPCKSFVLSGDFALRP